MGKIILTFGLLFTVWAGMAREAQPVDGDTGDGAHFRFERMEHDFGEVPHRSRQIECSFGFTNDGTAPLVITKVLTSCTCVKVSYSKKPVMPGEKGVIVVAYEVNKKDPGIFYKAVEIYSNSVDKRINLIIKGNAIE